MRLSIPLFGGLILVVAAVSAGAAQTTFADPAGLCASSSPCFTSVSAAVAHAGPAPAQVFVFPGTYAERVILNAMGSAIGEAPGDLSIVSVDAAGQPAPGAVIDTEAPGGPGFGPAIGASGFPGSLVLDGLVARSFGDSAIELLSITHPVLLSRISVSSGLGHGVGVYGGGDVRVVASSASDSRFHGFSISVETGTVEVESSFALGNGDTGFELRGSAISVRDCHAENNGRRGFGIVAAGTAATAVLEYVQAILNDGDGVEISRTFFGEDFAVISLRDVVATSNLGSGVRVFSEGAVVASGATVAANDGAGLSLAGGSIDLSNALALSNDGFGLVVVDAAPSTSPPAGPPPRRVTVLRSRFEGNAEGSMELAPPADTEVRIGCSDLLGNGPAGLTLLADVMVDSRSSFWGDPSGPFHPDNPGGTGDPIRDAVAGFAGTVLYDPFLPSPASPADCPARGAVEIPALDPAGLALLALLLGAGALARLRLCGRAGRSG